MSQQETVRKIIEERIKALRGVIERSANSDFNFGKELLFRWVDRTRDILRTSISTAEAERFDAMVSAYTRDSLEDYFNDCGNYLIALHETIADIPIGDPTTEPVAPVPARLQPIADLLSEVEGLVRSRNQIGQLSDPADRAKCGAWLVASVHACEGVLSPGNPYLREVRHIADEPRTLMVASLVIEVAEILRRVISQGIREPGFLRDVVADTNVALEEAPNAPTDATKKLGAESSDGAARRSPSAAVWGAICDLIEPRFGKNGVLILACLILFAAAMLAMKPWQLLPFGANGIEPDHRNLSIPNRPQGDKKMSQGQVNASELPLPSEFGWRIDNPPGALNIAYFLEKISREHFWAGAENPKLIGALINWAFKASKPPTTVTVAGKDVPVKARISYINRSLLGKTFGSPEHSFRADIELTYLGQTQPTTQRWWQDSELPVEIREIVHKLDDLAWQAMRENLAKRIGDADLVAKEQPRHVFISYRETAKGRAVAERIDAFLRAQGLVTWFFPYEVGWGDNQYRLMEDALSSARAAVIVFTPDFMSGASAKDEYYALLASRNKNADFKVGLLLVGVEQKDVPPFMSAYFNVRIAESDSREQFETQARRVYRGLIGLPLEAREEAK